MQVGLGIRVAFITGWLALAASSAVAQPAAEPAPAPQVVEPAPAGYREAVDAAVEEFDRGNWTEAYALFARAHAVEPNARTLRGMGVCAFEAKKYVQATTSLRAALTESRRPLDPAQRAEAEAIIARAEPFLARVSLTVEPAGAQVEVDSQPPVLDGAGKVLLDPGMHQIAATRPGHDSVVRVVEVSSGDSIELTLRLTPSTPARDTPVAAPTAVPAVPIAEPRSGGPPVWAYVAGGASVVFAGAGVVLWVLGKNGVSAIENACSAGECTSDDIDHRIDDKRLEELSVASPIAFAFAGAAAVTAVVLFVADFDGDRAPRQVALTAGTNGIAVQGTF